MTLSATPSPWWGYASLGWALIFLLAGCASPPGGEVSDRAPLPIAGAGILAAFEGGEIRVSELDARVLSLPHDQRPRVGEDRAVWYEEQLRLMAVEHLLLAEADAAGITGEESFRSRQSEVRRQLEAARCLPALGWSLEPLTNDELRAAYAEQIERFTSPEQREVYHLFRRRNERDDTALETELEGFRLRVLQGENFRRLASATSESETRHREGLLGRIRPGQMKAELEDVLFALDEGVPSKPVLTPEGGHLFYVEQIFAARDVAFDEAREILARERGAKRRESALQHLEDRLTNTSETPPGSLTLSPKELAARIDTGSDEAPVMRLGDYELTLRDLRARAGRGDGRALAIDSAWSHYRQLLRRERILLACRAGELVPEQDLEKAVSKWRRRAQLATWRDRRLRQVLTEHGDEIAAFHSNNRGLFSLPPRWRLRRLTVPLPTTGRDVLMHRLERARADLDAGALALETLAAELGGRIDDDAEPRTLDELAATEPKLRRLIPPLQPERCAPPFRASAGLLVACVLERFDPVPRELEEVREVAETAYLRQHEQELFRELRETLLTASGFRVNADRLADLAAGELGVRGELMNGEAEILALEELLDEEALFNAEVPADSRWSAGDARD